MLTSGHALVRVVVRYTAISPLHRAAAGSFAAMTGLDPDVSRPPDKTWVCCAGWGTASPREMVTGQGFRSPNQPDEEEGSLCTVPDQDRIRRRAPFVLPFSATRRGHPGNLGINVSVSRDHSQIQVFRTPVDGQAISSVPLADRTETSLRGAFLGRRCSTCGEVGGFVAAASRHDGPGDAG